MGKKLVSISTSFPSASYYRKVLTGEMTIEEFGKLTADDLDSKSEYRYCDEDDEKLPDNFRSRLLVILAACTVLGFFLGLCLGLLF